MHNFVVIKKILVYLMKSMDGEADLDDISADVLEVSELRRAAIFRILVNAGLIDGMNVAKTSDGEVYMEVFDPAITLKGLEYLYGNKFMFDPESYVGAMFDEES